MDGAIFERLKELNLPAGDYAVFGSAPLLIRGIIDDVDDLDIISRGSTWVYAQTLAPVTVLEPYGIDIVDIDDGLITIGTTWGIGEFDLDELIDTAEVIDDIPFVRLRYVEEYKRVGGRPKDLDHLERLDRWRSFGLRAAVDDDHDFMWAIQRETLGEYIDRLSGRDVLEQRRVFERNLAVKPHEIIEVASSRAGFFYWAVRDDHVYLGNLIVAPEFQRRGIGKALTGRVIQEALERSAPVRLQVLHGNPAIDFYRSLGFAEIGRDETHVKLQALS